ncbi:MAG: SPOR domain-containing protein [Pseudomonadota bacterium]
MNEDPKHTPMSGLYANKPQHQSNYRKPRRVSIRLILAVVLTAFLAVVWYAFPRGADRYEDIKLPVIHADKTSYKTPPENPGGMVIPHQDSTVFEPLESADSEAVENLLPAPEEPVERAKLIKVPRDSMSEPSSLNLDSQLTEEQRAEAQEGQEVQIIRVDKQDTESSEPEILLGEDESTEETAKADEATDVDEERMDRLAALAAPEPEEKTAEPKETSAETSSSKDVKAEEVARQETEAEAERATKNAALEAKPDAADASEVETEVETKADTPEKPAPAEAKTEAPAADDEVADEAKPAAKGSHYIQMGSFQDRASAEKAYDAKVKQYNDLIADLGVDYERADLGDKGVFYRVKAGPLPESEARNRCEKILAQTPGACLVVR